MVQVSFVIPCYNVEKYLARCVKSILTQNLKVGEYEVVLVNDGSNDNTLNIAMKLASLNNSIRVISQVNKGLAGARNTGIRDANGEYLLFVDPDDTIEPDSISKMIYFAVTNDLEIAMFSQRLVKLNGEQEILDTPDEESVIMPGMEMFNLRSGDSACKYLIKRTFLTDNDLYFFEESRFLEDAEWSARLFSMAKRTAYKRIVFYNYILRGGSLVTSGAAYSDRTIVGYIKSAENLRKFSDNKALTENQRVFLNTTIAKFVLLSLSFSAIKLDIEKIKFALQNISLTGFEKLNMGGLVGRRFRHAFIYNISPWAYVLYCYLARWPKAAMIRLGLRL